MKLPPFKYFQRRSQERLYRQWVERAGLPPESVPAETEHPEGTPHPAEHIEYEETPTYRRDDRIATHPDVTGNMMHEINKQQRRLFLLYVLLGAAVVILLVSLILILVYSC